ncbi:ABC transporter permease [Nocardioides campestrisoli]|uniref:ABC transporter permease n=1 Tax=Nocardioides campestrisoli TaxID=2736757 RepID=UPI0015E6ED8B|nr:ABC transporter permease subunit [Nocardioides campestrisoli]
MSALSPTLAAAGRALLRALLTLVFVVGTVLPLWVAGLWIFEVSDYVGKGPADVWAHLVTDEDAGQTRSEAWSLLVKTLQDAALGFVAGMLAATALAGAIVLSRAVESAVLPMAMILRSVPLIALAPLIILLVGRGYAAVAVMSGIVVLFPALVSIVFGLRSHSAQMRDVVQVFGGSSWAVLRRVAFPSALPALFASVRISVPGAITGALLAEWLATGEGIGYAIVSAAARSQINQVWSLVVVITLASLVLYLLAQLVESVVLARFGQEAGRA